MKLVNVKDLEGAALDWAVAKCEGYFIYYTPMAEHFNDMRNATGHGVHWTHMSTDWAEGGPIIERELGYLEKDGNLWQAVKFDSNGDFSMFPPRKGWSATGATALIAAMRCYVMTKLGDEVEVPKELIGE